jgi:hypothetical protein
MGRWHGGVRFSRRREGSYSTLIARERGSDAGGRVVLSLHVRVSNHASDPHCNSLSTSFSRAGFRGVGRHRR